MLWDTINMLPESLMFNGCTEILGNFRKPESWNLQIWVDPWIHMSCSPHLHPTPVASPSPGRLLESQIPGPTPDPRNQIRWRWSPAMCVSTSPLVASKCENHCYKILPSSLSKAEGWRGALTCPRPGGPWRTCSQSSVQASSPGSNLTIGCLLTKDCPTFAHEGHVQASCWTVLCWLWDLLGQLIKHYLPPSFLV